MLRTRLTPLRAPLAAAATVVVTIMAASALAKDRAAAYQGNAVRIGKGSAHTVVRTDGNGKPISIGVVFKASALEGLPKAAKGASPDFLYLLSMPGKGPKTVVDHVVINWESAGHPPPKVYDTPHFDFHFYVVSRAERTKIKFRSEAESGDPAQQPPGDRLPAGYIVPPGTAVSGMGIHAINQASSEFKGQPFTATFIYGYHNKRLMFIEPMVSLEYLKSKPAFSAPVARPASYGKPGAFPSSYSVKYDEGSKSYEVTLADLQ